MGEKKGKERKWKGNERGRIQLSRQIQPITPATIISGCSLLGICLSVEWLQKNVGWMKLEVMSIALAVDCCGIGNITRGDAGVTMTSATWLKIRTLTEQLPQRSCFEYTCPINRFDSSTMSLKKDIMLSSYNFDKYPPILIIFDRKVAEREAIKFRFIFPHYLNKLPGKTVAVWSSR